jgi:hypothetical protein
MQALMLNPRFKSLILISNFFIGHELGVAITTKFERKFLYFITTPKVLSPFTSTI